MNQTESEELKKYKEYVKKRLSQLIPIIQKAAVGDFSGKIEIPEQEDEFSELFIGLSLMMDDLRELEKTRKQMEEERRKREEEAKKRLEELEQWRELTTGRELKMIELKEEIKRLKRKLGEPVEE